MEKLHFYIHWPFCESLCPYCDFNSFVAGEIDREAFLQSYLTEIRYYASLLGQEKVVKTVFFGGGTPSLMTSFEVEKILDLISKSFNCEIEEITLEANPSSSESKKFTEFKRAGINRLSIGVQSFDDKNLKILGRRHGAEEAIRAISEAAQIFENFSFDLMYGVPNQTAIDWERELNFAVSRFDPPHISAYNLTIEKGTDFFALHRAGKLVLPDHDVMSDMYCLTNDILDSKGYVQYEVSNHAKKGRQCLHNLGYWQVRDYIGIGAGAHGRIVVNGSRMETMNLHLPLKWSESVAKTGNGLQKYKKITEVDQVNEILLMGMRIEQGVDIGEINSRLGINLMNYINQEAILSLKEKNLIIFDANKLIPTKNGIGFVNKIVKCLLGE